MLQGSKKAKNLLTKMLQKSYIGTKMANLSEKRKKGGLKKIQWVGGPINIK